MTNIVILFKPKITDILKELFLAFGVLKNICQKVQDKIKECTDLED